jgi:hypothetical protein
MSALPVLFLLFDAAIKLVKPAFVVEATVALGYSESVIVPLGVVLLVCTILYFDPQTAVLGAILLTGYLGGAVASPCAPRRQPVPNLLPGDFRRTAGAASFCETRGCALVPWPGYCIGRDPELEQKGAVTVTSG